MDAGIKRPMEEEVEAIGKNRWPEEKTISTNIKKNTDWEFMKVIKISQNGVTKNITQNWKISQNLIFLEILEWIRKQRKSFEEFSDKNN